MTFKKYIAAFIILFSFATIISTTASAQNIITVFLNGNQLSFDENPRIEKGTTLVPMRKIFESLGATITYDPKSQTVFASKSGTNVTLPIGSKYPVVNGKKMEIQVPGKIVNGRTLVPLRFVSETLGATVNWNEQSKKITITSTGTQSSQTNFSVVKIY